MSIINEQNTKEHSYPVYGRQFKSYRWYKPIVVAVLFLIFYFVLAAVLTAAVVYITYSGLPTFDELKTNTIFASGYDNMDLANPWQSVMILGSIAAMIPALWLASGIVRDRPFSSYSSARGGWSSKVFWKAFPVAFICISVPILIDELVYKHNIDN